MNYFKQQTGQFFTTNAQYICGDLINIIINDYWLLQEINEFIDPFAGNCDLLNLITLPNKIKKNYDINPINTNIKQRDSLLVPPIYQNVWVITNPPWLAKNKNKSPVNKQAYMKYQTNDLYKCAMLSFCQNPPIGGTIIIPLNFWCEEQKSIRAQFLSKFMVDKVKVFEEQVFYDTTYTACAFNFKRNTNPNISQNIIFQFWNRNDKIKLRDNQANVELSFELSSNFDYRIGKDFFNFCKTQRSNQQLIVSRLLKGDHSDNQLILRAQDTGSEDGKIKLFVAEKPHFDCTPKASERTFAGIKITNAQGKEIILIKEKQQQICDLFNNKLNEYRQQYHSLCLTNFRNSTQTMARKRISFDIAYQLVKWAAATLLII